MKEMNEDQKRRLADAPVLYRPIIREAYTLSPARRASPRRAIKAFCLQCVGYVRKDVTECTAIACPLWHYRPYQAGDEPEDDDGPALGAHAGVQNAADKAG